MTTTSTCPQGAGRIRRRLHAIDVLVVRLALLAVAGFLLFIPLITQIVGVLLGIYVIGTGSHATFSSFRRAWTGPGRKPQRYSGVRLRGRDTSGAVAGTRIAPPVVVDVPPHGDGGQA